MNGRPQKTRLMQIVASGPEACWAARIKDASTLLISLAAPCLFAVGFFADLAANKRSYFNSDYTQSLLAAMDITTNHNVLLHGWVISSDNFYITDTLFYVLLRPLFRTNIAELLHIPALVYLTLAALAVLIVHNEGKSTMLRNLSVVFAALMLAAIDLNGAAACMLVSDQHAATLVLGLAAIVFLQRAEASTGGRDRSGWTIGFGVALALAVFSDPFALAFLTLPLVIYLGFRLISGIGRRGAAGLFIANLASAFIGAPLTGGFRHLGGFAVVDAASKRFADASDLPSNFAGGAFALLHLFGAYVFGKRIDSLDTLVGVFDLLLLMLVLLVAALAIARNLTVLTRPDLGFLLALSIFALLAADFSSKAFAIAVAGDTWHGGSSERYLMPVFVIGVALVAIEVAGGRLKLANQAASRAMLTVLMVGAFAHFVTASMFDFKAGRQQALVFEQPEYALGDWLVRHHLTRGVADYWEGNSVTALTEGRVVVRAGTIDDTSHRLVPYNWNSSRTWRDAFDAPEFVVFKTPNDFHLDLTALRRAGLSPARVETVGTYTVAVLSAPTRAFPGSHEPGKAQTFLGWRASSSPNRTHFGGKRASATAAEGGRR